MKRMQLHPLSAAGEEKVQHGVPRGELFALFQLTPDSLRFPALALMKRNEGRRKKEQSS
ncbi:hypothetical protein [Mucilaginibacter glaciei]|uniref:Uncharacterized protein n=1 Tax=Mucilaginibacter glaciei TaxID=2772109 RepID=A0A926S7R3_9SPHI|nr:hypothetical protein [Mucilaginibacter glaciei]MBD1394961.1 hypothetical protein [Mucilaginibacter glaciei]